MGGRVPGRYVPLHSSGGSRRRLGARLLVGAAGLFALLATAVAAPVPALATAGGQGPLSPRLAALARTSSGGLSPATQDLIVGLPASGAGSLLRQGDGRVLVDVKATDADAVARAAQASGAQIVAASGSLATLAIEPSGLGALSSVSGLLSANEVLTPEVSSSGRRVRAAGDVQPNATCPSGVVSEGDAQLRAALARSTYSVNGTGVKVGVLSDSFDNLGGAAADVASGDLPGVGNPCGFTTPVNVISDLSSGGTDEGRAMAQIVHDLAPGAQLLFASASKGELDFANQILALKAAGATVIVDDVTYFDEPIYQDGVVAAAINTVTAAGASYFSSAANSTVTVGGKSIGSYEAQAYRPTTCPSQVTAHEAMLDCHDFDPGPGSDAGDVVAIDSGRAIKLILGWNEPQFGVTTDLDLFLIDQTSNNLVAVSSDANAGHKPFEFISYTNSTGANRSYRIVVGRPTTSGLGTPRFKIISSRSRFTAVQWNTSTGGDVVGPTTFGHNAALSAQTIAAVPASDSTTVESFSSEGPAAYCWQPVNGSVPAAAKPCVTKNLDFAATDGVTTTLSGGLNPFFGTSAAAPHAAAVNALMRQARPCKTAAQLQTAEAASGRPVGAFGVTSVGSGLVDAVAAIAGLGTCGVATVPAAPTGVSAVAGPGSATVSWTAGADGGSAITGYQVTPFIGGVAQPALVQTYLSTGTTQTVGSLTAGTTYTFRVAAINGIGTGPNSTDSNPVTPTAAATVPTAPTIGLAIPGDASARLSWSPPASDGGSPITGYRVTPYIGASPQPVRSFASTANSEPINGLTNGVTYTFKVRAVNAVGEGPDSGSSNAVTPTASFVVPPFAATPADDAFVIAAYTDFLGRPPTGTELADRTAALRGGTLTRRGLVDELALSPEWVSKIVNDFYQDTLGRPGDAGGVAFWSRMITDHKLTVAQVGAGFYASPEYFNGIGGGTNASWITDLYSKILGRSPDAAGLASWTAIAVAHGRTSVAYGLYQSNESRHARVAALYDSLLKRAPDAAGADYWATRIQAEGDIALAASLASSNEYYQLAHLRFP